MDPVQENDFDTTNTYSRVPFNTADFLPHVAVMFGALHSIYEDIKLSVLSWSQITRLGPLLVRCASLFGATQYKTYYLKDINMKTKEYIERDNVAPAIQANNSTDTLCLSSERLWLVDYVFREGLGTSPENCRDDLAPLSSLQFLSKDTLTWKIYMYIRLAQRPGCYREPLAIEEMVKQGYRKLSWRYYPSASPFHYRKRLRMRISS